MTTSPMPARETQAPFSFPFTHLAGTDADVTAKVWKAPRDLVVDRVQYLNPTGLAEGASNFAAFTLRKALVFADILLNTGFADLTNNTVNFVTAGGVALKHALETGDGPVRLTTTGALPTGLAAATDYWVIRVDDFKIGFATTLNNAIAGTKIDLTGQGSGVNTLIDQAGTKRYLVFWSTNSAQAGDNSVPANAWMDLTPNRSDARDVPRDTELEFFIDEEGTTNPPAGFGVIEGRYLK